MHPDDGIKYVEILNKSIPNHMKFKSQCARQKRQRGDPRAVWYVFFHCLSVLIKGTVIVTLSNTQCGSSLHPPFPQI